MSLLRAFGLAICKLFLIVAGLFVVAVMIPFRKTDESTRKPFTQHEGEWVFTNIHGWFGNPFDGLMGDKRGWFANWCREKGIEFPSFLSMYVWAAIRNPVNYWSRCVVGVDVSRCTIEKLWGDDVVIEEPGQGGAQYLRAICDDGEIYDRLFIVLPYPFKKDRAFMLDIGWKIKLSHNGTAPDARPQDRFKGIVFTGSFWKGLS